MARMLTSNSLGISFESETRMIHLQPRQHWPNPANPSLIDLFDLVGTVCVATLVSVKLSRPVYTRFHADAAV
jgi:hypothetical protein